MKNKTSTKDVAEKLSGVADVVSVKNGVYTAKRGYFYGMFGTGEKMAFKVIKALPGVVVLDYGNHYHDFVGGAKTGSKKSSYYWVTFELPYGLQA